MKKFKEFIENVTWNIKAFILQPIIPVKTMDWVIANNCSWSGNSGNGKWQYYWYKDFKTGYQVKVKKEIA